MKPNINQRWIYQSVAYNFIVEITEKPSDCISSGKIILTKNPISHPINYWSNRWTIQDEAIENRDKGWKYLPGQEKPEFLEGME